jgi:putative transposase
MGWFPRLTLIWTDGGYAGALIAWAAWLANWTLEIVKRSDEVPGFKLLRKRWIVERTFGLLGKWNNAIDR